MTTSALAPLAEKSWAERLFRPGAPRVAVVMMHKNEDRLLPFWFAYTADLFGAEAITILDNGSTHAGAKAMLAEIASLGATVVYEHDDEESYRNKGMIALEHFARLRRLGYDYFFPLDCDEFLAFDAPEGPSIAPEHIFAEIARTAAYRCVHISGAWVNNPYRPELFNRRPFPKVFGRFEQVKQMGCGYHGVEFPTVPSAISYFHYHLRPYADLVDKARAKVLSHGRALDRASLKEFVASGASGHKSARELLVGEGGYLKDIDRRQWESFPALAAWFEARLGRQPFAGVESAA